MAGSFGALLVGWLVVVARAVSCKTPIYFIIIIMTMMKIYLVKYFPFRLNMAAQLPRFLGPEGSWYAQNFQNKIDNILKPSICKSFSY